MAEGASADRAGGNPVDVPNGRIRWRERGLLAAACALVIGVYALSAHSGFSVSASLNAADEYYNLLAQGFRAGQLSVKKELPPELARLAPSEGMPAKIPDGVLDLSYYRGRLFLYFGVTPAVLLFWPYAMVTGHYLHQKDAALIFCSAGFLFNVGLLYALWRRYFAKVSIWAVIACAAALGLTTGVPVVLARCDVYEVAISCGYSFTMLALAALWKSLQGDGRQGKWLIFASLAYGLAVGTRPSLLFGAVVLLLPVAQARRDGRKVRPVLIAAAVPIVLIGLGLMTYNALRFENPFEFGFRYQLTDDRPVLRSFFSLDYIWFNFRVYFLALARWTSQFPFVHTSTVPHLPKGHGGIEDTFGVFTNIPLALGGQN
jgi:hypothetical protein